MWSTSRFSWLGLLALLVVGCRPPEPPARAAPEEPAPTGDRALLTRALATPPAGWTVDAAPEFFAGEAIYDKINGAGEIPRACGFVDLGVAVYRREKIWVTVEIYEMRSASGAFGLYGLRREPDDEIVQLTHRARLRGAELWGWRGRHAYCVWADPPEADARETLLAVARTIEATLPEAGRLPVALRLLPATGRVADSAAWFQGKFALDPLWFEAENVLKLSHRTEVVTARYADPAGRLFVISYPDPAEATAVVAGWRAARPQATDRDGALLAHGDLGQEALAAVGERVVLVTEADSPEAALTLLQRARATLAEPGEAWAEG